MSCLQLCHWPWGSATPGTKMFLTCSKNVYMTTTTERLVTIKEDTHIYSHEDPRMITCHESYAALRMNRGVCICFTSFWGKKHWHPKQDVLLSAWNVLPGYRCIVMLLAIYILPFLEVTLKCMKAVNSLLTPTLFENNVIRLWNNRWTMCSGLLQNEISFI